MIPTWTTEPAGRKGFVKLTCPRKDCGGVVWVPRTLRRGRSATRYGTAPCMHCFRVAALPTELLPKERP